jgi:glycosyltransferase involved in cell wall biosynthesis
MKREGDVLIISQVYPPDPAAVGQYIADAADGLAGRGWRVRVLAADCGYDDPGLRFPSREEANGIRIDRLPWSSLGKRSLGIRLVGMLSFLGQALLRGLGTRDLRAICVSTSPPMAGAVAWLIAAVRRVPLVYWVMDLNPDQAVASRQVRADSPLVWLFALVNARVLRDAAGVIALDRFMAERLKAKSVPLRRLAIIPPWPLDHRLSPQPKEGNPFRRRHGLEGKFVVMYSGNHSLVHSLDTLLAVARELRDDAQLSFVLVGGGVAKAPFEAADRRGELRNVVLLPYQPLGEIATSLSAADLQLVVMGDAMVGCVHPCKFYGALAVGRPVMLIGPAECHVTDVFRRADCGWRHAHGDVAGIVARLRRLAQPESARELAAKARAGLKALEEGLSRDRLRRHWGNVFEDAIAEGG